MQFNFVFLKDRVWMIQFKKFKLKDRVGRYSLTFNIFGLKDDVV